MNFIKLQISKPGLIVKAAFIAAVNSDNLSFTIYTKGKISEENRGHP
jgi:hypothetical protein